MGLDLNLRKDKIDAIELRRKINDLYDRMSPIKAEIEELENEYDNSLLYCDYITHNLTNMAQAAGLYYVLWRPEELGITMASEMIPYIENGLKELKLYPEKYHAYNPANGYGHYDGLVAFCEKLLYKCKEYPDATIEVSR